MNNLNAIIRLSFAALLAIAGLGLVVYGAIQAPMNAALMAYGAAMVGGSGLTAWDARVA